jgi:hypothetical protein
LKGFDVRSKDGRSISLTEPNIISNTSGGRAVIGEPDEGEGIETFFLRGRRFRFDVLLDELEHRFKLLVNISCISRSCIVHGQV